LIRIGVSGWKFLLVPAYPGCPGSKAVKRSLSLLLSLFHLNPVWSRFSTFFPVFVSCRRSLAILLSALLALVAWHLTMNYVKVTYIVIVTLFRFISFWFCICIIVVYYVISSEVMTGIGGGAGGAPAPQLRGWGAPCTLGPQLWHQWTVTKHTVFTNWC